MQTSIDAMNERIDHLIEDIHKEDDKSWTIFVMNVIKNALLILILYALLASIKFFHIGKCMLEAV